MTNSNHGRQFMTEYFKTLTFSSWPDKTDKLLPPLRQLVDKIFDTALASNQEIFFSKSNLESIYVFIETAHFKNIMTEIFLSLEQNDKLIIKNRLGKQLSRQQLHERTSPAAFEIALPSEPSEGNVEQPSIYIVCGQRSEIQIDQSEITDELAKIKLALNTLVDASRALGINPIATRESNFSISLNLDTIEARQFVDVFCEIYGQWGDWTLSNDQGKTLSMEQLRSRSKPGGFSLTLKNERFEKSVVPTRINILFGEKFKVPEKKARFIKVSDQGAANGLFTKIMQRCSAAGIDAISGGSSIRGTPRINIAKDMYPSFRQLVTEIVSNRTDIIALTLDGKEIDTKALDDLNYDGSFDIGVVAHANKLTYYHSCVEIACWHPLNRADRVIFGCNRPSTHIGRVDKFSDISKHSSICDIGSSLPDPMVHNFPIDVVYTWVDGQDQKWLNSKKSHEMDAGVPMEDFVDTPGRWHNRDELRYSIRSIEMFAPFVRNIYIVTDGQCPNWLDQTNPRIRVVDHKEIFLKDADLPTFNSHSIECNLHHIEGLSEHFIYLNDDMLLGRLCHETDFFEANGIAKIHPEPLYIVPELIVPEDAEYIHAGKNVVELFQDRLDISPKNTMRHIPYSIRRSVMFDLESEYRDDFSRTSSNRFRSVSDISPISFMYCHYAFAKGIAVVEESSHRYIPLWARTLPRTLDFVEKSRKYKFICLNDSTSLASGNDSNNVIVSNFFNNYFPIKSSFEF